MSERGSFVTEYVYCNHCFNVLKKFLICQDYCLASSLLELKGEPLPIIAGKIGGSFEGEEVFMFMHNYGDSIENEICHDVRVAVLGESGGKIFTLKPANKDD